MPQDVAFSSSEDAEAAIKEILRNSSEAFHQHDELRNAVNQLIGFWREPEGWVHSVCHLFEDFGIYQGFFGTSSLLDRPDFLEAAEVLVNKVVSRATAESGMIRDPSRKWLTFDSLEEKQDYYDAIKYDCVDRIIISVIWANLEHAKIHGNIESFYFKPSSLNPGEFIDNFARRLELKGWPGAQQIRLFAQAKNIKEYIERCAAEGVNIYPNDYRHDLGGYFEEQMSLLRRILGSAQADSYRQRLILSSSTVSDFRKNRGTIAGIFVDVEGTLILDGQPNAELIAGLNALKRKHPEIAITIFSDGKLDSLSSKLAAFGLDQALLPVVSKELYRGKKLAMLIDNTKPEMQQLAASEWHAPGKLPQILKDAVKSQYINDLGKTTPDFP